MNSTYGGVSTVSSGLDSYIFTNPRNIGTTTLDDTLTKTNQNSIDSILINSQINYTIIGIVAKENSSYKSGYGVADHVSGSVTLVIFDTEKESRQYIPLDLGPKKEEGGQPGVNLVEYIKSNYPNLEVLVTGRRLVYQDPKIKNETAEPGTDIDDVIANYEIELEETTTEDDKVTEYAKEVDEDYVISDQNLEDESNPEAEGELVTTECKSEGEASETTE